MPKGYETMVPYMTLWADILTDALMLYHFAVLWVLIVQYWNDWTVSRCCFYSQFFCIAVCMCTDSRCSVRVSGSLGEWWYWDAARAVCCHHCSLWWLCMGSWGEQWKQRMVQG